jgi:hypothetical protein
MTRKTFYREYFVICIHSKIVVTDIHYFNITSLWSIQVVEVTAENAKLYILYTLCICTEVLLPSFN